MIPKGSRIISIEGETITVDYFGEVWKIGVIEDLGLPVLVNLIEGGKEIKFNDFKRIDGDLYCSFISFGLTSLPVLKVWGYWEE